MLFDLDDTLNDRAASWMNFVRFLLGAGTCLEASSEPEVHAKIITADRCGYRPKDELFADLRDQLAWRSPMTAESVEAIWRGHFPACMVCRDGVVAVLAWLKRRGVSIAIVTNGRSDAQLAKITHMGIGSFLDAVITSEAAGAKKPDGVIFRSALTALSADAADALFVGDNPRLDVVGPAAVGMRTAWLKNDRSWPSEFAPPTYQFNDFVELQSLLNAIIS